MNSTIIKEKTNNKKNNTNNLTNKEYKLTSNNFNPAKYSPNLFLSKLEFRMKHYYLEQKLNNDKLTI